MEEQVVRDYRRWDIMQEEGGGRRLPVGILQKPTGEGGGEEDVNAGGLDEVV
jgi:hypothetical protein